MTKLSNKTLARRIDADGATFLSPFERWPDHNYAPYALDYVYNQKTDSSEIIAPLHGFRPQDVHITITRGQIIILMGTTRTSPVLSGRNSTAKCRCRRTHARTQR